MTPATKPATRKRKSLEQRLRDSQDAQHELRKQIVKREKASDFRLTIIIGQAAREAMKDNPLLRAELLNFIRPSLNVPRDQEIVDAWLNPSTR